MTLCEDPGYIRRMLKLSREQQQQSADIAGALKHCKNREGMITTCYGMPGSTDESVMIPAFESLGWSSGLALHVIEELVEM